MQMSRLSKIKDSFLFSFYIMRHPFAGFWQMQREKKGRLSFAFFCVAMVVVMNVFNIRVMAFQFNADRFAQVDMKTEILSVALIYVLLCVSNWSVTCLMDGEGSMRDIFMAVGYACMPLVLLQIPTAVLSNLCSYSEYVYVRAVIVISWIWFGWLLLSGLMTIHQYSLGKMAFMLLATAIAMMCIVFVYLLFVSLFTQMFGFVYSIYKEIVFRV